MPCLEETPKDMEVIKAADTPANNELLEQNQSPQEATRELTQTDRLNNKLLKSFLERMNTGSMFDFAANTQQEHKDEVNDEFE